MSHCHFDIGERPTRKRLILVGRPNITTPVAIDQCLCHERLTFDVRGIDRDQPCPGTQGLERRSEEIMGPRIVQMVEDTFGDCTVEWLDIDVAISDSPRR